MKNQFIFFLVLAIGLYSCQFDERITSGYLKLERQYFSQQSPDSLVNSFTRTLFFNERYSFLSIADSSATADDHFYIRDYKKNLVYLKKSFNDQHYYASFPIKNQTVKYTNNFKTIQGYQCQEGIYIDESLDTTVFFATKEIGSNRTIWSLLDVKGFVLEVKHPNGIKKVTQSIQKEAIHDAFFENQIDSLKGYNKTSYYGLKIVEAEWEVDYYHNMLKEYQALFEENRITKEDWNSVQEQIKGWVKNIKTRIQDLKKKNSDSSDPYSIIN